MPPRAPPTSEFELWACARLRALYEARCDDHRRGTSRKHSKFGALMRYIMGEYEDQPFARASYKERYDRNGKLITSDDDLRKMADTYLRNHSREPLARLALFEQSGGVAADHPHKAAPAMETWAAAHKELINPLVCAELGILPDTAPADWPDDWIGVRKAVVSREFGLLPEDEQQEWRDTALGLKMKLDAEAALPVAVQTRQEEFNGQLTTLLKKKFANKGLGNTFFVGWHGFYIGADDHSVHRFRGQSSSYKTQIWAESKQYHDHVSPSWTDFVRKQTEGHHVPHLPMMTGDPSVGELNGLRTFLKAYLQLMFDLAVDGPTKIDTAKFWNDVAERPFDFVAGARIPEGGRFADPTTLKNEEFKILYRHVFKSQERRHETDADARFRFEETAVQAEQAAMRLKNTHEKRSRANKKSTSSEEGQPAEAGPTLVTAAPPTLALNLPGAFGAARALAPITTATLAIATGAPACVISAHVPASPPTVTIATPIVATATPTVATVAPVPSPVHHPAPVPIIGTAAQVDSDAPLAPNEPTNKRKRCSSIPLATAEELAEMGDSLGARGYKTRNRENRRPVQNPTSSRLSKKSGRSG